MEQPSKVLKKWDARTSPEDRKEIYENLMGNPEFGRFLEVLKDFQQEAYAQALANPGEATFYLGSADMVNAVRTDIQGVLSGEYSVF